ncbi:hypothetical protein [Hyphobacterium sp.]|jgi:hypothetical protein|uniref:hypothetical protein n=1 Tax=Hyphobacterium sp. TaxID=2004662 RepID=UPI003BAC0C57
MAFDIQFPSAGNIVEFRMGGALSAESFSRLHKGLYFAPEWRTGMNCLGVLDAGTDISAITIDTMRGELRGEIERVRRLRGPDFKMAWVVVDDHNMPMVRLWKSMPFLANQYEIEIFRTASEAREWLRQFGHRQSVA